MKKVIVFIIVALVILGVFATIFLFPESSDTEKMTNPEARIEIEKVELGEITINQGDTIHFSAINSSDRDGKIEEYNWNFDDGTKSEEVDPEHSYDEPGEYTVTLTVTDNDGNENVTIIKINVVNAIPVAIAKIQNHPGPKSGMIPFRHSIQFDGTDSYDSDGNITSWTWDFGDGNSSEICSPRHQYSELGEFNTTLTITDNDGEIALAYLDIEIIKRTYEIKWNIFVNEINESGYTLDGQSSELTKAVQQTQLSKIELNLTWDDPQPFWEDNQTEGRDKFELKYITPENATQFKNSTSEKIILSINYKSPLSTKVYNTNTKDDAIDQAYNDVKFTNDGSGDWKFNITALECKGGNWINDQFDLDIGNTWSFKIYIYYFDYELTEITYDQLE